MRGDSEPVLRGHWFVAVAVSALVLASVSCGGGDEDVVDVFAAASLTDAFTDLAAAFERAHPDSEVRLNFAGTSTLREQLLDGADADVFVSANMAIMDELIAEGAVAGQPQVMASNTLVLAVPIDDPGRVDDLSDVSRPELLIGVCARGVPCGDLAHRFLELHDVTPEVDTEEPDVRSLARRLADRELDAALIYRSDVVADHDHLRAVRLDPDRYEPLESRYPIAAIDRDDPGAAEFVDFVLGPEGRSVLEQWGFTVR